MPQKRSKRHEQGINRGKSKVLDLFKLLYNAFVTSQFDHSSIIWIFCRKSDYMKMEKVFTTIGH